MSTAIQMTDLRKTYRPVLSKRGATVAVDGLTLEIERGEIFGLLGANGAGKTTTIKMIAGLILPDSGSVIFPSFEKRPTIGAVLEGSRNLYWRLSPWENIRYFGELRGIPIPELRRQSAELLPLYGLTEKRDKPAQTLSRGMQQKLAVVLALLGEPDILLLDEPTLGLDVESSLTIRQLLRRLCDERGITMVLTTHQMDVAHALARRIGIMSAGKLAACERVDTMVDLLRRQDYVARMRSVDWERLLPALSSTGTNFLQLDEQRPEQRSVRFMLDSAQQVYGLMQTLHDANVELLDFRQEQPTLEEVFLQVTS
ncbi:MAG: ABC transporter ATP-binding protein, partial [bacterium]|nr:ABC transporter ATP-binding protein [bacterium]